MQGFRGTLSSLPMPLASRAAPLPPPLPTQRGVVCTMRCGHSGFSALKLPSWTELLDNTCIQLSVCNLFARCALPVSRSVEDVFFCTMVAF